MALSCVQQVQSYDDGSEINCAYHEVREVDYQVDAGTGVTVQSYVDAPDFAARGWNDPRYAFSFFWGGAAPSDVNLTDWAEKQIIATQSAWAGATQVS